MNVPKRRKPARSQRERDAEYARRRDAHFAERGLTETGRLPGRSRASTKNSNRGVAIARRTEETPGQTLQREAMSRQARLRSRSSSKAVAKNPFRGTTRTINQRVTTRTTKGRSARTEGALTREDYYRRQGLAPPS